MTSGQLITDAAELPVKPGEYSVSVVFTQTDGHGAISHLGDVSVPGNRNALTVSDLALGRENSGVRWNSGATIVPLNPLNTYLKGGSTKIYFQLSGLNVGTSYQTKFEFYRADDDAKKVPRFTVSFTQPAQQERTEVSRSLGLQQFDPEKYRVNLTVSGASAETTATAWLTIVK